MKNSQYLNFTHSDLFALPDIKPSGSNHLTQPSYPEQKVVTGDREVDAVLWLHSVIKTGQSHYIDKAMEAARFIKTPLADLEKRYTSYLIANSNGNVFATFASIGFSDLEGMAEKAIEKERNRVEAVGRFGDALFDNTAAEDFCLEALDGIEPDAFGFCDDNTANERFGKYPNLIPSSLNECVRELEYWDKLYSLRNSGPDTYEPLSESYDREQFVFKLLAKIPPTSREESRLVHQCLIDLDRLDQPEYQKIVWNLIG